MRTGFNMAKQDCYRTGNFDSGQYTKNLKNLPKTILAFIICFIVFLLSFFITAVCHLEHNAERAAVEMEKGK